MMTPLHCASLPLLGLTVARLRTRPKSEELLALEIFFAVTIILRFILILLVERPSKKSDGSS